MKRKSREGEREEVNRREVKRDNGRGRNIKEGKGGKKKGEEKGMMEYEEKGRRKGRGEEKGV